MEVDPPAPVGVHRCSEYAPRLGEFDLTEQPYVDVTIRFYRDFNPKEMRGVTCLKIATSDVLNTETKKRVGSMASDTNGLPVLTDELGGHHEEFMCRGEQVWAAFQESLEEKRCPECGMLFEHKMQCSRREDGEQVRLPAKSEE
jgi:hypothetical protein